MGSIEERIGEMIAEKYGTVSSFSKAIGLPNSTVVGVLKRGVHNSGVNNVITICNGLGISVDALAEGLIVQKSDSIKIDGESDVAKIYTALMHRLATEPGMTLNGEPLTQIERYTMFDSLELELEKIRRMHDRERRNRE